MFFEQGLQERFRPPKACAFQRADCTGEINKAALAGKIEQAERTGNSKTLLFCGAFSPAVVD
jgi:hypothetical protein